jgi:histidinol phosphatase-like enzyme
VGDTIADLKAAVKIGARPVLVRSGRGAETEKELNRYAYKDIKEKTYIFDDLADFTANLEE